MPVSADLSITWDTSAVGGSSFTVGGSSARQLDGYSVIEKDFEVGGIEFQFITTATTAAAFATEVAAVEAAFRRPRGDLTVTQESQTLLSLLHSTSTGFNGSPRILKQGDIGDTGRSRFYHVRIEFGMPADNINTNYRRWATIKVDFPSTRQKTVTINTTYTANGATGAYAQYLAQIAAYASATLTAISASATWEKIGEPDVTRDDTDKVCNAIQIYKEKLFNDKSGTLDDEDIVDPLVIFSREKTAPGDSTSGGLSFEGGAGGQFSAGPAGNTSGGSNPTGVMGPPGGGNTVAGIGTLRPTILTITYSCSINRDNMTGAENLKSKWLVIRQFLIAQSSIFAGGGTVLIKEKPDFDPYFNKISASMEFHVYSSGATIMAKIEARDQTSHGRILVPPYSPDVYDYYVIPGSAVRIRTVTEEYQRVVTASDPHAIVDAEYKAPGSVAQGISTPDKWELMTRSPAAMTELRGLDGAGKVQIATIKIETTLQYRNKRSPSVANAGGITGAAFTA